MSSNGREMSGIPFIVSAPSGAGKTTLCKKAVDFFANFRHSISYTTRKPRPGEVNGVDYKFVDDAEFDRMIEWDEFIEHAGVYGRRYGTSQADLETLLSQGYDVILEIDVQGAQSVRGKLKGGVSVFILPPSIEACEERLKGRGKDSPEEIQKRLRIAEAEIGKAPEYDYIIINDKLEEAFEIFKSIIIAEKAKTPKMLDKVEKLFGAYIK
ncbi:MAG: guanylate kinase [Deltaproteobacteria bacterium]|nr:guanylate kinase [Deltaproteobacteria bacterium]